MSQQYVIFVIGEIIELYVTNLIWKRNVIADKNIGKCWYYVIIGIKKHHLWNSYTFTCILFICIENKKFKHRMCRIIFLIFFTELMHVCHNIQYNSICPIQKMTSYILFNTTLSSVFLIHVSKHVLLSSTKNTFLKSIIEFFLIDLQCKTRWTQMHVRNIIQIRGYRV